MTALHTGRTADQPDTLMLHCTLARHETLLPLAKAANLSAVLPDLLGHGQSPDWDGQGDYQTANLDAVTRLMPGPMHVIGHSFGGTIALRLAVDRPDLVTRLTLVEPVFFALAQGTAAARQHHDTFAPIHDAVQAGDLRHAARLFHRAYGMGAWDDIKPATQAALASRMPLVVAAAPAIQDDIHGVAGRLSQIIVPVTLIRGNDSQPVIADIHAAIRRAVPLAGDHVIDGAGHMSPLTHRNQVAALI